MPLFPKPKFPPVNASRIRVAGHEMRAVMHNVESAISGINDLYTIVYAELEHSDPTTQEGKALESIALQMSRMANHLALTVKLYALREEMITFGVPVNAQGKTETVYPQGKEMLICP